MYLKVYSPDGGIVCVTDWPFRPLAGSGICAVPFCGQGVDTYHESGLCFYHRAVALGRITPEVDKLYDAEARRILKGAKV